MTDKIPINPNILKWARKTAGLHLEDVAHKIGKDIDTIKSWESGNSSPTYAQLEKLAYQVYKRPLALFFFPEPPLEETPKQSFRTLPEQEIEMMSPRMHYLLRQALAMQINLAELNEGVNPAKKNIIHELNFYPDKPLKNMVFETREYLGIDLKTQFNWKNIDDALKIWRDNLEKHGVYVFKEAFKDELYSGFCLYDEQFPVIYINNSKPKTRQIFSIFHELAHLLFGIGGVDTRIDNYIDYLKGDDRKIEIICNRFAGEFLVPDSDFNNRIRNISINDEFIYKLADRYKVSREVILRKLRDRNLIDKDYYSEKTKQWTDEAMKRPSGTGGNYYATKCAYLGEGYLGLALSQFYQNKISINQLADYLGVKVKSISGIESVFFNKGQLA